MLQRLAETSRCAPLWKRLLSYTIDYFLSTIFISIIPMIITSILTGEKAFTSENFTSIPMNWRLLCSALAMIFAVYYFCIFPLRDGRKGQTIGKKLMGIRIVPANDDELTWSHMWRRELVGSLLIEGQTAVPSAFLQYFVFLWLPRQVSQGIGYAYIVISVASVAYAVFGRSHRMFHDLVGATKVVNARS